jgi:hypothetical protein
LRQVMPHARAFSASCRNDCVNLGAYYQCMYCSLCYAYLCYFSVVRLMALLEGPRPHHTPPTIFATERALGIVLHSCAPSPPSPTHLHGCGAVQGGVPTRPNPPVFQMFAHEPALSLGTLSHMKARMISCSERLVVVYLLGRVSGLALPLLRTCHRRLWLCGRRSYVTRCLGLRPARNGRVR